MKFTATTVLLALLATAATSVNAHGAIVGAQGIAGPQGKALGVLESVPRTGTGRNPFQTDTSIIRDGEIRSGRSGPCGRTIAGGNNDMAGVAKIAQEMGGLPQVAPNMPLKLTLHQVNADGAGPFACDISMDGTGNDFQQVQVAQNVAGVLGTNPLGNKSPHDLVVMMPANMQCTGGASGNMCMVRCRNNAVAGPFGGCVPVEQASPQVAAAALASGGSVAGAGGAAPAAGAAAPAPKRAGGALGGLGALLGL
ncbi:hypothetical protein H9P43_001730 [Blastocladiella emersonii ATCC 22665]|nr:hypothetical protein H9P43_001722 [Blastocladiella emersonii ATCC 22665]KAI9190297.1 hypothetical protein H9P43_001730 [Blastocladiella emersonii ATCC 22665]